MEAAPLLFRGMKFSDLFDPVALSTLTERYYEQVKSTNPALWRRFLLYREGRDSGMKDSEISAVLTELAGLLSKFLAELFSIEQELRDHRRIAAREEVIFTCKREFLIRRVLKNSPPRVVVDINAHAVEQLTAAIADVLAPPFGPDPELAVATALVNLLEHERYATAGLPEESLAAMRRLAADLRERAAADAFLPPSDDEPALRTFLVNIVTAFEQWFSIVYHTPHHPFHDWAMFQVPASMDFMNLVAMETPANGLPGANVGPPSHYRRRDGFDLTDGRFGSRRVMGEVDYCILCHEREKDSCAKGLRSGGIARTNPLGFELNGCPLGQRISESHMLKGAGDPLGALAMIMIDNPMVPGTGHRICNDCMKSCIYQKQDPVNIPQIETGILTDVLELPWGFEIYSLLTRWNPLNIRRPHALPYSGLKVLVVGLGPAGYTLAHYFLNEGFGVVGIDGLKIEPPAEDVFDDHGDPVPVREFGSLKRRLSERPLTGFGGVSEYGITVRWDKNFLTVIYLNLLRRKHFLMFDGIRFGGTLTVEDAWRYGCDHVCLATGAGKPTFVRMKNNMVRGIRKASDFLMALQLTGAGKRASMANLQVRLPAVVIGGGLTAIDTATELMAYYPVQVEKIKLRYDRLCREFGEMQIRETFDGEERRILDEFLSHAREIETVRAGATLAHRLPDFIPLVRKWGGVHILYRKSILDSPAYRLNHEEIIKGFEEGISLVERMNPLEAVVDVSGALRALVFEEMENIGGQWKSTGRTHEVAACTAIVAAGTVPNVMYEREHPGTFAMDAGNEFYKHHISSNGMPQPGAGGEPGFFTSYRGPQGQSVTFYGDNHPNFAGNVVKAMASAQGGFREVVEVLADRRDIAAMRLAVGADAEWRAFSSRLKDDLVPHVLRVDRLTPTITEVVVHAPKAAREFRPGQFYRLQNYEADSLSIEGTLVMMEGVALTGAWVDPDRGLVGLITLEVGASSRMCAMLKPGQRVVVMGPTGTPTDIGERETVILLGGGLGNAVLFSIGKAFRERGGKVIYFAGYRQGGDFFKRECIEDAADVVVFSVDAGEPIPARRPQDRSYVGNIIQAMLAYARGELGPAPMKLDEASKVIAIGSDRMMAAVAQARHDVLRPYLREDHIGLASINSPMQCMMKAVCAQCLQRHTDQGTHAEEFVFTCVNQDQKMDEVDFAHLHARLKQNTVMEKITNRWLDYLIDRGKIEKV